MKIIRNFFIIILFVNIFSCSNKNILISSEHKSMNVTRFSLTDEKTRKRYSGIFNENKEVLFYDEGIIYPFKGGFSYIHKTNGVNIAVDSIGKTYAAFELGEVYDSFYGYGLYSAYDNKNDIIYTIDKNGNKIKNKNIIDINEGIEIIKINKKMTYFDAINNSYLKNKNLYDICYSFKNEIAKVGVQKTNQPAYNLSYLYGLIDKNGSEVLPCEYAYLDYRCSKYVIASKTCEDPVWERKAEFGLLDLNNNWIIEPKYHYALPITDSVISLWMIGKKSEHWILYDIETKKTTELNPAYTLIDNINLFSENNGNDIILFYDLNKEKYGFLNSKAEIILNAICTKIEPFPDNGYWQVLIDNKWMLFKADEGILNPEEYLDFSKVK